MASNINLTQDETTDRPNNISRTRENLPQILAVLVKNVLVTSHGMILGYLTILIPGLSGNDPNETFHLNDDQLSWIGSITMLCVPLGCLLSGFVTQPIGRKRSMQLINIPTLCFWILMKFSSELWHVYLGLALVGLIGGLVEAPVMSFVAEITKPHLRGILSASAAFCAIAGVLIQFLLGTFLHWRTIALVSCTLPITTFFLLFFIPESPHWLIMHNKMDDARKSLAWLRGWTTVEAIEPEFQEICRNKKENLEKTTKKSMEESNGIIANKLDTQEPMHENFWKKILKTAKSFTQKNFLWPLAIVSFLFFLLHFTGATTLRTYAVKIFATLQTPLDKYHATVLLGAAEFLGSIVAVILVHYTGKRIMGFISLIGVGICSTAIATYAYLIDVNYLTVKQISPDITNPDLEDYKWIPLVIIILYSFVAHCGLKILPWILIGEIFPSEIRATGCGISGAISYVFGFLANKIFLREVALITIPGVYWFHGALSFLGVIILHFILPETEGKTLQEIIDHFAGGSKLGNHVKRKTSMSTKEGNINSAFVGSTHEITTEKL